MAKNKRGPRVQDTFEEVDVGEEEQLDAVAPTTPKKSMMTRIFTNRKTAHAVDHDEDDDEDEHEPEDAEASKKAKRKTNWW